MICQKCGKEISDTSKFCAFCGTPARQEEPVGNAIPFNGEATAGQNDEAPNMVSAAPNDNTNVPGDESRKSHTGVIIAVLGVIAVVILAAVVLLAKVLLGGNNLDSRVFYLKDSELSAITNIKASSPQNVQIENIRNGEYVSAYDLVRLSSDGSYLYYFSDVNSDGETGTLCRIPTGKLKLKESANDKLVEEIDSKVNLYYGYTVLEDNSVVYIRKSDELTWFNGSESYDLGECNGYSYQITDDEKYVVYLDDDTLVAVEISKKAATTEIDDDVSSLISVGDKDFILYAQENGDYEYSYCVAGIGKEPKVVADDVYDYYSVDAGSKSFYYLVAEEKEYSLYEYVNDPYASADAGITEPQPRDYMKKVKASDAISQYDQDYYSSMEDFKEGEFYYYDEACQAWLYNNYDDYNTYYYDEDEDQWYASPYNDEYDEAWSEYYAVEDRINLREDLKEETTTERYYSLYYYENGTSKEVCTAVNNIEASSRQALIYTKASVGDAPTAQYNIDDISSAYQLWEKIDDEEEEDEAFYFCNAGTGESEVTGLDSVSSLNISKDGKTVLITGDYDSSDYTYTILSYAVSSSGLSKENEVSGEAYSYMVYGNEFYYYEDVDDSVGTLYVFDGSKSYLLAENIATYDVFYADDGSIIGYSDVDYDSNKLAVYDKNGRDQRVATDVTSYTYLGKNCYLLMEDGDLYYMDKKGKETRLARNVSYYLYPGSTNGHWIN